MAIQFVVEDGSANPAATSYMTVAAADQHHENNGNAYWLALSNSVKQTALNRATQYIDKRFGRRFRGDRRARYQALQWPRLDAFDDDGFFLSSSNELPPELLKATAEYALRAALYNVLAPDAPRAVPGQDMSDTDNPNSGEDVQAGQLRSISDKIGPIAEAKTFITNAEIASKVGSNRSAQGILNNDFIIPEYPEADMWIERLIKAPSNSMTLVRGD